MLLLVSRLRTERRSRLARLCRRRHRVRRRAAGGMGRQSARRARRRCEDRRSSVLARRHQPDRGARPGQSRDRAGAGTDGPGAGEPRARAEGTGPADRDCCAPAPTSKQAYDQAKSAYDTAAALVTQIEAAEQQARATLTGAAYQLSERDVVSRTSGRVQDIFFRPGEYAPAMTPVVSILPPGNVYVRFFVPETEFAQVKLGQKVAITCDGCAQEHHRDGHLHRRSRRNSRRR